MTLTTSAAVGERLAFGDFELAPAARALWRSGKPVKLGSRALDILIALASRPGEVLSKEELTQLVWRGPFVDDTAVRVGVSAVRKALGAGADHYIATSFSTSRRRRLNTRRSRRSSPASWVGRG